MKTNGVGMAPYMVSVALMVAALSANVILSNTLIIVPIKLVGIGLKKLLLVVQSSSLATLILYGVLLLIGVDPAYPLATLGLIFLASWTFMALVTALIGWNNRFSSLQV